MKSVKDLVERPDQVNRLVRKKVTDQVNRLVRKRVLDRAGTVWGQVVVGRSVNLVVGQMLDAVWEQVKEAASRL